MTTAPRKLENTMAQIAFVSACTAALAITGCWMGFAVYGLNRVALVSALAGAAGGFGIGCAALDVQRRWREHSP